MQVSGWRCEIGAADAQMEEAVDATIVDAAPPVLQQVGLADLGIAWGASVAAKLGVGEVGSS